MLGTGDPPPPTPRPPNQGLPVPAAPRGSPKLRQRFPSGEGTQVLAGCHQPAPLPLVPQGWRLPPPGPGGPRHPVLQLGQPRSLPGAGARQEIGDALAARPALWPGRAEWGLEGRMWQRGTGPAAHHSGIRHPARTSSSSPPSHSKATLVKDAENPPGVAQSSWLRWDGWEFAAAASPKSTPDPIPSIPPQPGGAEQPIWNRAPRPAPGTPSAAAGNVKNPKSTKRGLRGCPEEFPGPGFQRREETPNPKPPPHAQPRSASLGSEGCLPGDPHSQLGIHPRPLKQLCTSCRDSAPLL